MLQACPRGCGGSLYLRGDGKIICTLCSRGVDAGITCQACGCVQPPGCTTHRVGAGSGKGSIFSVCPECPTSKAVRSQFRGLTKHIDRSNPKQRARRMAAKRATG
jgi:hypothetical protein